MNSFGFYDQYYRNGKLIIFVAGKLQANIEAFAEPVFYGNL